jgi:hypothetical protein
MVRHISQMARQGKARQGKARQGKARQGVSCNKLKLFYNHDALWFLWPELPYKRQNDKDPLSFRVFLTIPTIAIKKKRRRNKSRKRVALCYIYFSRGFFSSFHSTPEFMMNMDLYAVNTQAHKELRLFISMMSLNIVSITRTSP